MRICGIKLLFTFFVALDSCLVPPDTFSVKTTCVDQDLNPINCRHMVPPATEIVLECKEGYRKPDGPFTDRIICGTDGQWGSPFPSCVAKCGELSGGVNNTRAPWNVLLFFNDTLSHIGTVISERAVLTYNWIPIEHSNPSEYHVETGDTGSQEFQVESINDIGGDVTILKLKTPFIYNSHRAPICISRKSSEDKVKTLRRTLISSE